MGIDARILLKLREGVTARAIEERLVIAVGVHLDVDELRPSRAEACESTHMIYTPWRYYGPEYARGPWPIISAVLLELLTSDAVEAIWYAGGDGISRDDPFTIEEIEEFSRYYHEYANRPYYG